MKKLLIIGCFLIGLIAIAVLMVLIFPIKKAVSINSNKIEQQELSEKDLKLICKSSTETGSQWEVIGKDTGLFDLKKPCEHVIARGNVPKYMNGDIYANSSNNKFVLIGNIVGEDIGDDRGKYKVFQVKEWDIEYPVGRGYGFVEMIPTDSLTPYDFIPLP